MLGAYILSLHGHRPLLMDMRASSHDDDHIVTPFQVNGRWGCLSKPNHAALRFRNAVYRSIRELMMSYFDEYLSKDGERSLRSYSMPIHIDAVFGQSDNCVTHTLPTENLLEDTRWGCSIAPVGRRSRQPHQWPLDAVACCSLLSADAPTHLMASSHAQARDGMQLGVMWNILQASRNQETTSYRESA